MSERTVKAKTRKGTVLSAKMDKTIVVAVERREKLLPIGKYVSRTTKFHVHDETGVAKEGDQVLIKESRPISKRKSWVLVNVLEKAS